MNSTHPFRNLISQTHFVKLWISQLLSQLTIQLVNFLILTQVFEVTKSSVAVSLLWLAYSLPALFFAPISGAVVDRFSRRKTMIVTNLLQGGVVFLYVFVHTRLYLLYVLVFAYSLLDQLYLPSQQASLPSVVNKKLLPSANGLFMLTQQATFLIGFGLGGAFLATLGRTRTVILGSIFLVIAAVSVYLLPKDLAKYKVVSHKLTTYLDDFKLGFAFIKEHRPVLYPLLLIAFAQMTITIMAIILPAYTRNVLGLSLGLASVVLVIPGAIGAIIVTAILPKYAKTIRKKNFIEMGVLVAAVSMGILSVLGYFGELRWIVAIAVAIGMGVAIASVTVPAQTLVQEHTPTWFRGRVYSSLNFLLIVGTAVPLVLAATLADIFGVAKLIATLAVLLAVF
ncbi:MAG: MFS transporter, partial [bacterium]|nr:MFS transporter [bacterium]